MLELKSCPHCNGNGRIVSVSGFKSDRYRAKNAAHQHGNAIRSRKPYPRGT